MQNKTKRDKVEHALCHRHQRATGEKKFPRFRTRLLGRSG